MRIATNSSERPAKILIEGSKLSEGTHDGCYRYASELVRGLRSRSLQGLDDMEFHIYLRGKVHRISQPDLLSDRPSIDFSRNLVEILVQTRTRLTRLLKAIAPDSVVGFLKRRDRWIGATRWLEYAHQGKPMMDTSAYDLVHLTLPQAYRLFNPLSTSKFVVTIHDCTHRSLPDFHTQENVEASEKGIQFALQRRAHFIAVSDATRKEFLALYRTRSDKVTTAHLAADVSRFDRVSDPKVLGRIRSKYQIPGASYLLALSTLEPRKNLLSTVRAFEAFAKDHPETDVNLVIAGKKGWKYEQLTSDPSARSQRIHFTGFVDDGDLAALYSGAIALSFVSHYEGFGLPALEAMCCGTPVIYGNRGALPEVVGRGGVAAEPDDVRDIQERLTALVLNPALRREVGQAAYQRASQFSWRSTVENTLTVYRKALADV